MTGLLAETYAELVERVRELVDQYLPPGSIVGVVSRGDPAMLELGERVGWHVPSSDDGRYVGYHPADGPDAIRTIESVRARGADFLVVPETSSWWLSHYKGLREHLEQLGPTLAAEPGAATLFALSDRPSLLDREATERARVLRDLADLLALLLPPSARLSLIDGQEAVGDYFGASEVAWVAPEDLSPGDLASTQVLVIPCWHYDWLAERPGLRDELSRRGRLVTWQEHVGAIYEVASSREGV